MSPVQAGGLFQHGVRRHTLLCLLPPAQGSVEGWILVSHACPAPSTARSTSGHPLRAEEMHGWALLAELLEVRSSPDSPEQGKGEVTCVCVAEGTVNTEFSCEDYSVTRDEPPGVVLSGHRKTRFPCNTIWLFLTRGLFSGIGSFSSCLLQPPLPNISVRGAGCVSACISVRAVVYMCQRVYLCAWLCMCVSVYICVCGCLHVYEGDPENPGIYL